MTAKITPLINGKIHLSSMHVTSSTAHSDKAFFVIRAGALECGTYSSSRSFTTCELGVIFAQRIACRVCVLPKPCFGFGLGEPAG